MPCGGKKVNSHASGELIRNKSNTHTHTPQKKLQKLLKNYEKSRSVVYSDDCKDIAIGQTIDIF